LQNGRKKRGGKGGKKKELGRENEVKTRRKGKKAGRREPQSIEETEDGKREEDYCAAASAIKGEDWEKRRGFFLTCSRWAEQRDSTSGGTRGKRGGEKERTKKNGSRRELKGVKKLLTCWGREERGRGKKKGAQSNT